MFEFKSPIHRLEVRFLVDPICCIAFVVYDRVTGTKIVAFEIDGISFMLALDIASASYEE